MLPRGGTNVSSWCQLAEEGSKQPIFHSVKMQCFLSYGNSKTFFCFFSLKAQAQILNYLSWNSGSICICWPFDLNKLLDPHPPPPSGLFLHLQNGNKNRTPLTELLGGLNEIGHQ